VHVNNTLVDNRLGVCIWAASPIGILQTGVCDVTAWSRLSFMTGWAAPPVLGGPAGACSGFQWRNEAAAVILRLRGEGLNRFADTTAGTCWRLRSGQRGASALNKDFGRIQWNRLEPIGVGALQIKLSLLASERPESKRGFLLFLLYAAFRPPRARRTVKQSTAADGGA
jgi:hypothetical protein